MNKKNLWIIALIVLPVVAMIVANFPNAVTYQYPDGHAVQMSYMGLNEDVNAGVCMPAVVVTVGLCILFAVAYLGGKKAYWLKAISGPSFAAALLAVVPYLAPEEVRALPNVLVPILMMVEWLVAFQMGKTVESADMQKEKGRRLSR